MSATETWLSAAQAGGLLDVSPRHVRRLGALAVRRGAGNGGRQTLVALQSLPPEAQARYWSDQVKQQPATERRAHLERLNLEENIERKVAQAAGIKRRPAQIEPLPLDEAGWPAKRDHFAALPATMRAEAWRRVGALDRLGELLLAKRPKMEAFATVATEASESASTIRRWHKRVRNQERCNWHLFLAPDYAHGEGIKAEIHPDAWAYVLREWLVQSQPTITAVVRRAVREGKRQGWGALPSIKTFKRRIDETVPHTHIVLKREGEKALAALYPAQARDYSAVPVHGIWVSDGHQANLFVRFPDDEIERPILMFWLDVRTRKVLGWSVSKTENAPLVRASLRDAMKRSGALPRAVLLDNGRAYASKEISGGQPNRYRFKVNEDDMNGVLTTLQIPVIWATPGHGQAKPIESFWRTLEDAAKRAGGKAYCGRNPDEKPEGHDKQKAPPIADYIAALTEDIEAYHEREHRGRNMDGNSPEALYAALMATTAVRTPTAWQLRICLQAAEKKRLDADHAVKINGNRYWAEALAALPSRGPYTYRYDADDSTVPLAVYDGDRFICDAPIYATTGFRDQEAGKAHTRARNQFKKAEKAKAKALVDQAKAATWSPSGSPTPIAPQSGATPTPAAKVAELVRGVTKPARVATQAPAPADADVQAMNAKVAERARRDRDARREARGFGT